MESMPVVVMVERLHRTSDESLPDRWVLTLSLGVFSFHFLLFSRGKREIATRDEGR